MCLWKELHWKFSKGQVSVASCPRAALVKLTWSFPFISWRDPANPKAARSKHTAVYTIPLQAAGAAHVPRGLAGDREGSCVSPQALLGHPGALPRGRSGSYSPPGYCRTLRGQAGKGLESTNHHLQYWTAQNRTWVGGGAFWCPS